MATDGATIDAAGGHEFRSSRWFATIAIFAFAVVLVAGAVAALGHNGTPPNDDEALIDLQVFDVGTHTPLVGSYERLGGNQPGPLSFYLLAAPYRLAGEGPAGLGLGVVVLSAACVGGCVVVAVRRGGLVLGLWTGLFLAVVLLARGGSYLTSPWEPNLLLTVFALFVFLVWEYLCGTSLALPLAAATATVLAQAWVGTGIFVAALGGVAIIATAARLLRTRRRRQPNRETLRALVLTGVVLGVLWIPPVVEQFTRNPGNVTELTSIRHDRERSVGLVDGYRALAIEFRLDAPWLTGKIPTPPFSPTVNLDEGSGVPVAFIVFVAAAILAARRRARAATWLNVVVVVTVVAGVVSRALVFGGLFLWIAEPDRVVGMLCWFAAGYSIFASCARSHRDRVERIAIPVLTTAVVATAIALAFSAADGADTSDRPSAATARLATRALHSNPTLRSPVLITSTAHATARDSTTCCAPVLASILTRAGFDVVVPHDESDRYGPHRAQPDGARSELLITSFHGEQPPRRAHYRLVATADQLPPRQRARVRRIDRALEKLVGSNPSLQAIADAQARSPRVRGLYAEQRRIGDAEQLALYRRT